MSGDKIDVLVDRLMTHHVIKKIFPRRQAQYSTSEQMVYLWAACQTLGLMKLQKDLDLKDSEYTLQFDTSEEKALPWLKPSRDNLLHQRLSARSLAHQLGLYDASDVIIILIERDEKNADHVVDLKGIDETLPEVILKFSKQKELYDFIWNIKPIRFETTFPGSTALEDEAIILQAACSKAGLNIIKDSLENFINRNEDKDIPSVVQEMRQLSEFNEDFDQQRKIASYIAGRLGLFTILDKLDENSYYDHYDNKIDQHKL